MIAAMIHYLHYSNIALQEGNLRDRICKNPFRGKEKSLAILDTGLWGKLKLEVRNQELDRQYHGQYSDYR